MKLFGKFSSPGHRRSQRLRSDLNGQLRHLEKTQFESAILSFISQDSIARLKSEKPTGEPSIAVVAPMPPAKSGVAYATLSTFLTADYGVDIYAPYESIDEYLNAIQDARLIGSNIRVFSVHALPIGRSLNAYRAQVFIVGNSDHNIKVGAALWHLKAFPVDLPTYVYIHDPCLLSLTYKLCHEFEFDFEALIRSKYGPKLTRSPQAAEFQSGALVDRHVYGLKALLSEVRVDGIIVNSKAAAEMVHTDFPEFDRGKVHKLFHPVFLPSPAPEARGSNNRTRIGTFGIPSARAKGSDVIVDAFRLLQRERPDIELLIAGYGAHEFVKQAKLSGAESIIIEDSPSDLRLQALMRSCHVAVQLRRLNLGESSGVVHQLLALGKPTIVSAIGAFLEFDGAVAFAPTGVRSDQLAALIGRELDGRLSRDAEIDVFVAKHSPARFCRDLMRLIDDNHSSKSEALPDACARDHLPDIRDRFIASVSAGRSFIDVGGLYEIVKERVSVAREHGATKVTLLDIEPFTCPWWEDMRKHLGSKGVHDCQFISGDIQKIELEKFDVVYSSGVLYHVPSPLVYLAALRRIAKEFVILGTTVLPRHIPGLSDVEFHPATMLYVPATPMQHRQEISRYFAQCAGTDFFAQGTDPLNNWYGNWCLPTVQSLVAMSETVGFDVVDCRPIAVDANRSCALLLRVRKDFAG